MRQLWHGAGRPSCCAVCVRRRPFLPARKQHAECLWEADLGYCPMFPSFLLQVGRNVVHGSDSVENGERETGELPIAAWLAGCH